MNDKRPNHHAIGEVMKSAQENRDAVRDRKRASRQKIVEAGKREISVNVNDNDLAVAALHRSVKRINSIHK